MKCKIISCYFGKLPTWITLWLKSCKENPDFEFLLVTDDRRKLELPKNVAIHYTTLVALREEFQKNFDFTISLHTPYKLCDYKPIYYLVFEEYIRDFDYWGHCDLDMVFGDLKQFLFRPMKQRYDKIGSYGHLTLYRNTNIDKKIYSLPGSPFNYKTVFSSPQSFGFDEMRGINLIALQNDIKWYQIGHDQIADKFSVEGYDELLLHHMKNFTGQKLVYYMGKIYQIYTEKEGIKLKELMYYHFSQTDLNLNNIVEYDEIIFKTNCIERMNYIELMDNLHKDIKKDIISEEIQISHGNMNENKIKDFLKRDLANQWIYIKYRLFKIKWKRKIQL